jgi:hypothetical protein
MALRATLLLVALVAVTSVARSAEPATASPHLATELRVGGALIRITLDADDYPIGTAELVEWVRRSATIVAGYYGTFPVASVAIRVAAVAGSGVRNGRASADPSPRIQLRVGRAVSSDELLNDWVLVHEMTHLALPEVGRDHAWLAEGLATYVEGVARVQAGNLEARALWQEDVAAMPKGLPQMGDEGLDHTHTWGRTYWGGAIFCLAADVAIREQSANTRGLQDALRAILRESGGMVASWKIERILATGDAATGTTVLTELYRSMRNAPTAPDLPDLWRRLGLSIDDGAVREDTVGARAAIRDAITRPRTSELRITPDEPARP